ncbi:CpXC domain-containing protein [Pseudophaeobacter sp.]|uniref:CpXC domain-containing protein n=1 Tax=Pseudophaeobacter sp. TaxID=1971739 RepID=UPI00329A0AFF
MSLFHPANLVCPNCQARIEMMAVGSVNADRRPDLRDEILENRFQDVNCPKCSETFRLQPSFNYLDVERGQWIAAMPANRLRDHLTIEDEASELFAVSYGDKAPEGARAIGTDLRPRVTFGWPAVREKLLLREHDLDDTSVEMLKLDILRNLSSVPLSEGIEFRVVSVTEETLELLWLETATEKPISVVTVPRSAVDSILERPEAWQKMRDRLEEGWFVDMQKTYMGAGRT